MSSRRTQKRGIPVRWLENVALSWGALWVVAIAEDYFGTGLNPVDWRWLTFAVVTVGVGLPLLGRRGKNEIRALAVGGLLLLSSALLDLFAAMWLAPTAAAYLLAALIRRNHGRRTR